MDIESFYYYGQTIKTPAHVEALAKRIINASGISRYVRLSYRASDGSFYGDDYWASWHLVILEAHTGMGADILDYSNAAYIEREYQNLSILDLDVSGTVTRVSLPLNDDTEALLFPGDPADTEVADEYMDEIGRALGDAVALADYLALDEDDYSQREWDAWEEALEYGRPDGINDNDWDKVCEWLYENYYGSTDPGYVSGEWITEAISELNI